MTTFRTVNGRLGTRNGRLLRIGAKGTGCCPECTPQIVGQCRPVFCADCPALRTITVQGAYLEANPVSGGVIYIVPSGMTAQMNCIVNVNNLGFDYYQTNNILNPPVFTGGFAGNGIFGGGATLTCGVQFLATAGQAFWRIVGGLRVLPFYPSQTGIGLTFVAEKPVFENDQCHAVGNYFVISANVLQGGGGFFPNVSTLIAPTQVIIS